VGDRSVVTIYRRLLPWPPRFCPVRHPASTKVANACSLGRGEVFARAARTIATPLINVLSTLPRWAIAIVTLAISACSGPTAPDSLTTETVSSLGGDHLSATILNDGAARPIEGTFPLINGSFTLTLRGTDGTVGTVSGHYSGSATLKGRTSGDLDFQIAGATGTGATVTAIEVEGTGALIDEGSFALTLSFVLAGSRPSGGDVIRVMVRGTSQLSCSATDRILVTLRGVGSTPRLGTIDVEVRHEVENTECFD
jgi:hypothetical protein